MIREFCEIEGSEAERLDTFFKRKHIFVKVNPGNVILPRLFCELGDDIEKFAVRSDDIWMISYPRSGSTWTMEMVWLLGNKFDYERAKLMQPLRAPLLELTAFFKYDQKEWHSSSLINSVEHVKNLPSQRFIKSHLPWQLLPTQLDEVKPKVIYIARNPKDLCVSFYHHCALVHGPVGSFEEFVEIFLSDSSLCGSIWNHMLEFWLRRNESNILFLKYEEMKKDLRTTIDQCAKFIGIDSATISKDDINRMCDYLQFDKMQKNKAVNLDDIIYAGKNDVEKERNTVKFIRKGQIGDWKNFMSNDISQRFDKWIEEHARGTGLHFDYE